MNLRPGRPGTWLPLLLLAAALPSIAGEPEPEETVDPHQAELDALPRLLQPRVYHGDEVEARSGESWLGLCPRASGDELVACKLKVATVRDEIVDDEGAPPTGKEVSASCGPAPIFLVPASLALRPGMVRSLPVPESLPTDRPLELSLGDATAPAARLEIRLLPATKEQTPCELVLARGAISQALVSYGSCEPAVDRPGGLVIGSDAVPALVWAGDLDGDGEIDLVLDVTEHYNVTAPVLFLSAPAPEGALVKAVAAHFAVGC